MPADAPNLFDIVDRNDYDTARTGGYIKVQTHPAAPYLIHNYTDGCTWDEAWTPATTICRGLITDATTGTVLARPFPKFFNHDQRQAPTFTLDEPILAMDKVDGSLGITYPMPDGTLAIATRGSFASDQALFATRLYAERYAAAFTPNPAWTYLFEIVYPDNRIVLDYGDTEDLILLGAVDIATGTVIDPATAAAGWPGPVVTVFDHTTIGDVLSAPERDNAEGFVVFSPRRGAHVKIKFAEYKRLHKILTGVTARHVWEALAAGMDPADAFAGAPDEFHAWVAQTAAGLTADLTATRAHIDATYATLTAGLPAGHGRREFAEAAKATGLASYLFTLLDGGDPTPAIWKQLKPAADRPFKPVSSDAN